MFANIIRGFQNNDWSEYTDYLSPVFFEVVPAVEIAKQTAQLGKTFAHLKHPLEEEGVRALIKQLGLPVYFRQNKDSVEMFPTLSKSDKGKILLKLYFGQIMGLPYSWLDLRSTNFEMLSKECIWKPGGWIMHWQPEFLSALQSIYRGLYLDDPKAYADGLKALKLEHAAEIFPKHLGEPGEGRFKMKYFRDTFHDIFISCRENKTSLHPNFFALGLLISSLYEHLDSLGAKLDVAAVFRETVKSLDSFRPPLAQNA